MVAHIMLVGNSSWSMYNFRRGLIKSLLEKQYSVTIVAPNDDYSNNLKSLGCNFIAFPLTSYSVNLFKELYSIVRLAFIYKRNYPDIIFHYTIKPNIYGSFLCKFLKIPCIAITTGLGYTFSVENTISKLTFFLYRLTLKSANEVWFLNKDDRDAFISQRLITLDKALILNGEGIDTSYFKNTFKKKSDHNFRFILVSRMIWDKGIKEFVDAAKKIKLDYPNVIFQLLGPCDIKNPNSVSYEQINVWEKAGIIEYLGHTDDVRPHVCFADCVVLPSYYREGIPRTLMEASSLSKPIITSNNVGCKEAVIDGVTGFLCEPKSIDSLQKKLRKVLLLSNDQVLKMGESGRYFIKEFFEEKNIIKEYHNCIDRTLEKI